MDTLRIAGEQIYIEASHVGAFAVCMLAVSRPLMLIRPPGAGICANAVQDAPRDYLHAGAALEYPIVTQQE